MKRFLTLLCAVMLLCIGCSAGETEKTEPIEITFDVSGFNIVMLGSEGEGYIDYVMSKEEHEEFLSLLQTDRWTEPGELPARGFEAGIIAKNSDGDKLFISIFDEERTIILMKYNDRPNEGAAYFAPIEVAEDMAQFGNTLG